jgi:hypothetical protein
LLLDVIVTYELCGGQFLDGDAYWIHRIYIASRFRHSDGAQRWYEVLLPSGRFQRSRHDVRIGTEFHDGRYANGGDDRSDSGIEFGRNIERHGESER